MLWLADQARKRLRLQARACTPDGPCVILDEGRTVLSPFKQYGHDNSQTFASYASWKLAGSSPSVALLGLTLIAGAASAQSDKPWDGSYAGVKCGRSAERCLRQFGAERRGDQLREYRYFSWPILPQRRHCRRCADRRELSNQAVGLGRGSRFRRLERQG